MTLVYGVPSSPLPRTPSTRYLTTNPLRREYGIRLLTYALPEPLRVLLLRGLRRPPSSDDQPTQLPTHNPQHHRLSDDALAHLSPSAKSAFVFTELTLTRRAIEAPLASISRLTRNTLLVEQGVELRRLYLALVAQVGQTAALAVFRWALDAII